VLWEVEYFVVLGVLAVFVERLRRRFPLAGAPRRNLYLHVLASLCFTVLHPAGTAALVAIDNLFLRSGEGFRITFWPGYALFFHHEVLFYWFVVGIGEAVAYDRRARRGELLAARLCSELADARLLALQLQLHPHFLHNVLGSVVELLHIEPASAARSLSQLASLLERLLAPREHTQSSLFDELELIDAYLELARTRFGEKLCVERSIEVDVESQRSLRVPTLLLQPLVENAVRHGLRAGDARSTIRLKARRRPGFLELEVENDLLSDLEPPNPGFGLGLANTRRRVELVKGARLAVQTYPSPTGSRFRVLVVLPESQ
jgi:two-component system LytT family sensor kinase